MKELDEILQQDDFSRDEIVYLLQLSDKEEIDKLYARADAIRKAYCTDEVHLRGIIEFSNHCQQNCLYCGLREDNISLSRYRMSADEIIDTAKKISNLGIRTIVLQSGEDSFYDTDIIAYIIYSIKQSTDAAVTLSIGERGFDEYRTWKIAGADRYLLKHESANPGHYFTYHLRQRLEERINHLRFLKRVGYQIGSGNMIGLPKQSLEDIADDILLCKELDVDMAAFGPFIPAPFTPYHNFAAGSVELTLKTIAIARILLKKVHIPATTALDVLDEFGREKGLKTGANVLMPNFTPDQYKQKYEIYPNKNRAIKQEFNKNKSILQARIEKLGRSISQTQGNSLKML
jgi:biotin synthase